MNNNTAILVLSCDKYADIWQPFFQFFKKYWADCPFPVYLGTNEKGFEFENVKQIFSRKKTTWSDELQVILNQIPEKYVIIILEDYFIYKKVNNNAIFDLINSMEKYDAAYLKLGAFPKKYDELWPHQIIEGSQNIAAIEKGSKYRLCLQTAIWNKNILLELLEPSESPWEFEIEGSKRSNNINNPFLTVMADPNQKIVHGPIQYYCTGLSAGKWMRSAVELCENENITIDLSKREVESFSEELVRKFYIALPIKLRKVMDFFRDKLIK